MWNLWFLLFLLSSYVLFGGENKAGKRVKYEGRAHGLSLLEALLICHSIEE